MTGTAQYFLNTHAYCCELNDGAVILELTTGSYVGISAIHLANLRLAVRNWPSAQKLPLDKLPNQNEATDAIIAALLMRGILTHSTTPERSQVLATPDSTLSSAVLGNFKHSNPVACIAQFAIAVLVAMIWNKDRRLASILDWFGTRQRSISRQAISEVSDFQKTLLAGFFRLRIWFYTADRRCLFDSLVLAIFLTRQRIPCTLVIGVSTKPFLAHSWVQIGKIVLNDTPEHVQTFTPILVAGNSAKCTVCSAIL